MGRGNIKIDESMTKTVVDGKIIIPFPTVLVGNRYYPMFSISSPTHCDNCGNKLHVNSHYTRFILSSYGVIALNITYWTCPVCEKHFHDQVIGVPGSANYSYEFYEKQMSVRYDGRCSLNNSRKIGETYTEGLTDVCGRAPYASSLCLYEQKQAEISKQELLSQEIGFDGTLYIDGKWVKKCGKKKLEALFGRELSKKEWNKMRYKSIYVVATKEKVILDFEVTKYKPKYEDLIPLITRIKNRFPEGTIQKIVSDEDTAIKKAIKAVLPKIIHGFCIFHQLKNVTKRYCDEFKSVKNIPDDEKCVYDEICQLIRSDTVIDSVIHYRNIVNLRNHMELSKASSDAISYAKKVFLKNKDLLNEGFTPETDNTMEQIFSLICDFINAARSFKSSNGLANFCYNLFMHFNKRSFCTGKWRGFSPLIRARFQYG